MYFVERSKINKTLIYIDKLLETFDQNDFKSDISLLALERLGHMLIESILDVGNMMIDGFIMRDPGSYEDIIDILVDEKVIPSEDEKSFKEVIGLRSDLVREYLIIDHEQIKNTISSNIEALKRFSTYVATYLEQSTGVANAFSNEEQE